MSARTLTTYEHTHLLATLKRAAAQLGLVIPGMMPRGCDPSGTIDDCHRAVDMLTREQTPDPDRDLAALLTRQFEWSLKTFGGEYPREKLFNHIRKELEEIEADPHDPVEWIDVALLALDGAWRCSGQPIEPLELGRLGGHRTGGEIAALMVEKMAKNRARKWNVSSGDEPNEHVRDESELAGGRPEDASKHSCRLLDSAPCWALRRSGEDGQHAAPVPCDTYRPYCLAPAYCWCGHIESKHVGEQTADDIGRGWKRDVVRSVKVGEGRCGDCGHVIPLLNGKPRCATCELKRNPIVVPAALRESPFDKRAADNLADEVAVLIQRGVVDSRSLLADALLDYRDPPTSERALRLFRERKHEPVHPDNLAVDRFSLAMKRKLAAKRGQGYRGWDDKNACPPGRLQQLLIDHLAKGDPVDVGNFAMMLFSREEQTQPAHPETGTCGHAALLEEVRLYGRVRRRLGDAEDILIGLENRIDASLPTAVVRKWRQVEERPAYLASPCSPVADGSVGALVSSRAETPRVVTCTRCDGVGFVRVSHAFLNVTSTSIFCCPRCVCQPELLAARRLAEMQEGYE